VEEGVLSLVRRGLTMRRRVRRRRITFIGKYNGDGTTSNFIIFK
jgi:hypothetical protein